RVPAPGRLAQRESASFTPKRSLVRSQYRPPRVITAQEPSSKARRTRADPVPVPVAGSVTPCEIDALPEEVDDPEQGPEHGEDGYERDGQDRGRVAGDPDGDLGAPLDDLHPRRDWVAVQDRITLVGAGGGSRTPLIPVTPRHGL